MICISQSVCVIDQMFAQQFETNIQYLFKKNKRFMEFFILFIMANILDWNFGRWIEFEILEWFPIDTQRERWFHVVEIRKGQIKSVQKIDTETHRCLQLLGKLDIYEGESVIGTTRLPRDGFHTKRHSRNILSHFRLRCHTCIQYTEIPSISFTPFSSRFWYSSEYCHSCYSPKNESTFIQ